MMTPERAREMLGGLASGILTPEERRQLFLAALYDQTLFNEIADELEFAAFLESPEARAQLANRIEVEPERRRRQWLRPRWLVPAGAIAAAVAIAIPVWLAHRPVPPLPKIVLSSPPPAPAVITPAKKALRKAKTKAAPENVAVLDFANAGGAQAADLVNHQLVNSGQVNVIDRGKVQQAQAFLAQSESGQSQTQEEQAASVGRQLGADAVIVGSVGNSFVPRQSVKTVSVKAEVIDTRKARSMAKAAAAAPSLRRATAMVGNQLQSQFPVRLPKPSGGSVDSVDGDIVTVAFDAPGAVRIGDRFEILREGQRLGTLIVNSVSGRKASGKFTGTTLPRAGDKVVASSQP
jgi:hypothetical protein